MGDEKHEESARPSGDDRRAVGISVGAYTLEVGADCRSFARFSGTPESRNLDALAKALEDEGAQDDLSAPVAALEKLDESAAEVTDKIEHAQVLFRSVLAGRFDRALVMREIDGLIGLSERLDRAGRYEEQIRLAKALHGLLATTFRWLDLLRTLRRALRSAKAMDDHAAQAWALHELGTLRLSAGDPNGAGKQFRDALRLERHVDAGSCTTRHNLDCARRDLSGAPAGSSAKGPGRPGRFARLLEHPGAKGVAVLVVVAVVMAVAGIATGVALSRDQAAPQPKLGPDALSFGALTVGETSARRTLTVRAGAETLRLGRITVGHPDEFLVDSSCPAELQPGAPCTIDVRFRPGQNGTRATELRIGLGGGGSLSADLRGLGIPIVPASLVPEHIDLGKVDINARSRVRTLILRAGTKPLEGLVIATDSGEFQVESECPQTLGAGTSCSVRVVFAPARAGARAGTLTVTSASGDRLSTQLLGTGLDPQGPKVDDPPELGRAPSFGKVELGRSDSAGILLIAGSKQLDILDVVSDSKEFMVAEHCPRPLAARESCLIEITFAPTTEGPRGATLTVLRRGGPPLESDLRGTGVKPPDHEAPTLTTPLDLGESSLGTPSPAGTVVVTAGSEPLVITDVETGSEEFQADDQCPQSLEPGQSCPIRVVFVPAVDGLRTATLTVTLESGRRLASALSGIGVTDVPPSLESSLEFGKVDVGSTSPASALTLTAGSKPLTIVDVKIDSHEFRATPHCPATLDAGATCSISVLFTPESAGPKAATLTVIEKGGESLTSSLTGTAVPEVPPVLARSLDLGDVELGSRSQAMTLTLTAGSKQLAIRGISSDEPREFRVTDSCPRLLATDTSCSIEVVFSPLVAERRTSTLEVALAGREPLRSRLTGSGLAPPRILPSSVDFGHVVVRSRKLVRLRVRAGSKPLAVIGVRTSDPKQFIVSSTCDATLEPGASCSISLLFRPLARGPRRGILTVALSDRAPLTVPISGVGVEAIIALDPPSLDFGSVASDMPDSHTLEVRLTNAGDAPLAIKDITSSNRQFSVKSDCPSTLEPGATCSFLVTFNPSQATRQTATITIDASGRGPHTLTATGEGVVG